jgi:hydroxyacylglutathione hydrolase
LERPPTRRSIRKDRLRIESFVVPPLANNVFILYEDGWSSAVVIDVAMGSKEIAERLHELELKLDTIVNTHGHTDHTAEDETLRRLTGAKLAIHELDAYRLATEDEASMGLHIEKIPIEPDIQLTRGSIVPVGPNITLKVMHTPGHTEGSICLYEEKLGQLFSGDTLFAGTYGRVDTQGGSPEAMFNSLGLLLALPGSTDVYPGHGPFTKIESETWLKDTVEESSKGEEH